MIVQLSTCLVWTPTGETLPIFCSQIMLTLFPMIRPQQEVLPETIWTAP